jgi:hypothetical protein
MPAPSSARPSRTRRKVASCLVVFMCNVCHAEQEADPGAEWWFENVFKTWLRRRYLKWKAAQA